MFRKFKNKSITISRELHDTIAKKCPRLEEVPSEVICVRVRPRKMLQGAPGTGRQERDAGRRCAESEETAFFPWMGGY